MKKLLFNQNLLRRRAMQATAEYCVQSGAAICLSISIVLLLSLIALAQEKQPLHVSVTTNRSAKGAVVSIAANGSLSQAQTWQDGEGFHVVVPNASVQDPASTGKEISVRRVGQSVEIIVRTKSGTYVGLQRSKDRLRLSVEGELDSRSSDLDSSSGPAATSQSPAKATGGDSDPRDVEKLLATRRNGGSVDPNRTAQTPSTKTTQGQPASDDDGFLAAVFSGTGLLVVSALGLFGVLVSRKIYATRELEPDGSGVPRLITGERHWESQQSPGRAPDGPEHLDREAPRLQRPVAPLPLSFGSSAHGPYRISHEINCLIAGQHHRAEVLSSSDEGDRRAIEAALLQVLSSTKYDQGTRARVRTALERYGFVARQCAALLRATEPFERTAAARSLGEIACPASLPFLLEALHDSDPIVRNQAVASLGRLQMPAAVDGLRDMAKRYPDLRPIINNALKLCSEGAGNIQEFVRSVTTLTEAKPEDDLAAEDDELIADCLLDLKHPEAERRLKAAKDLESFRVKASVEALCDAARHDVEANVRSQAIASLGSIDHESVFPAIVIGMADESREVRAAAARSMSRLRFDRANAYLRLVQTADKTLLEHVAEACFTSGLVSQNIDRLANRDRRQGYEAFTLLCLLAKANRVEAAVELISAHAKKQVREIAITLLAHTGRPNLAAEFRELAAQGDFPEDVKAALIEPFGEIAEKTNQEDNGDAIREGNLAESADEPLESAELHSNVKSPANTEFEIACDDRP